MHQNREILLKRVSRVLKERIIPGIYTPVSPLRVRAWRVPRHEGLVGEPIKFSEIPKEFPEFSLGKTWGCPWETTWFRFQGKVPAQNELHLMNGDTLEARIDLGWQQHSAGFQAEGLVRDVSGNAIKAINPFNQWVPLPQPGQDLQEFEFYVEAAANPLLLDVPPFQPTADGDKTTAATTDIYTLTAAEVVIRNHEIYHFALDVAVLLEMVESASECTARELEVLLGLSTALDCLDFTRLKETVPAARKKLQPLLERPTLLGAHRLFAVGHAHIDSAWLWPLRETRRKVARTLANVVRLLEDGKTMIFALPAAQHVAWVEQDEPQLFERVKSLVKQGKIVPVGGMWVESDAVMPSGESLARQLVEGLDYFETKLGVTCQEVWLPDSFGYTAALPQLARAAGISRFLTQKISWNQTNVFPHHTMWWEGLDGSRVFTHFPPADTYGSAVTGAELRHAVDNFKEAGKANSSLLLYGYGDGGGGPTREMLERLSRVANLEGSPQTISASPKEFFDYAQAEYQDPPTWVGELYLELHRGTLSSHIIAKQGNRRSEAFMREAELWAATAASRGVMTYPYEELREIWHQILLCQFHDILPGTAIAWVYREVGEIYESVRTRLEAIICTSLEALSAGTEPQLCLANASSFEIAAVPAGGGAKVSQVGDDLVLNPETLEIANSFLRLRFDDGGRCVSLQNRQEIEFIPAQFPAGVFQIHQDFPNQWDAWDIDCFYRGSLQEPPMSPPEFGRDAECVWARSQMRHQNSTASITWKLYPQTETVDVCVTADFHEQEQLLKLAFGVDIHTDHAQFETQMGFLTRPIHDNTSWDAARFEISAHRWLRLENPTRALSIANDSTYGWDITRHHQRQGTFQVARATLLKTARYPDPKQDQGEFTWNFRLHPQASVSEAIQDGQDLNLRRRRYQGAPIKPLVSVAGAVVESISLCPDQSGDVVVRIYEGTGGHSGLGYLFPRPPGFGRRTCVIAPVGMFPKYAWLREAVSWN
ncbi:alpha-mannosidase [Mobiluncus mulieris]|uniref:alpha-mannosidase n=1 Tax=Mobiluncus mulieris TaxID=2052 RepID=UPI002432F532|nr:glycoside hydrolase family 38 C-terminal domain-containing protein [Mobiluncus mulieris]